MSEPRFYEGLLSKKASFVYFGLAAGSALVTVVATALAAQDSAYSNILADNCDNILYSIGGLWAASEALGWIYRCKTGRADFPLKDTDI